MLKAIWEFPFRVALFAISAVLTGLVVGGAFALTLIQPDKGELAQVWQRRTEPGIMIFDKNDKLLMMRGGREAPIVALREMPDHLWQAFLAIEDRRYYEHGALELQGIARALTRNIKDGATLQGGSTITQQLVKNMFLSADRTLERKVKEAYLSYWVEEKLTKDQILTLYLNRIFLGAGNYGVEAAARYYFGKSARDVTLAEAAMLAGLPKAPTRYAPTRDLAVAQRRAGTVLDTMVEAGYLDPAQAASARAHPATIVVAPSRDAANYYVDWVLSELWALADQRGAANWKTKNLIVYTTFDSTLELTAELAVRNALSPAAKARHVNQAALVALAPDGAVRAMVGGDSYFNSQFNRVTQAKRQSGSVFKAFTYLAALEHGMTPDSMILDAPITIGTYAPTNSDELYAGEVPLKYALENSLNAAAVRLTVNVGIDNVIETARRLGITSPLAPEPGIALGIYETSLLEMSGAYLSIMRGGLKAAPYGIRKIVGDNNKVLYQRAGGDSARVIAEPTARTLTAMLEAVVARGTGIPAQLYGRQAAGKTGTSQDYRDALFIGFTPDLLTGVWVGNDDNSTMDTVVGGSIPARMWKDFMDRALDGTPAQPLPTLPKWTPPAAQAAQVAAAAAAAEGGGRIRRAGPHGRIGRPGTRSDKAPDIEAKAETPEPEDAPPQFNSKYYIPEPTFVPHVPNAPPGSLPPPTGSAPKAVPEPAPTPENAWKSNAPGPSPGGVAIPTPEPIPAQPLSAPNG